MSRANSTAVSQSVQYPDPEDSHPIPGASHYRLQDGGVIWSNLKTGVGRRTGPWHTLKHVEQKPNGYFYVTLALDGGGQRRAGVHVLVLEVFKGPCPPGMEARHFPDRNKANNFIANLSWGTPKENGADRVTHGTATHGEDHHTSKLTDYDIREIFRLAHEEGLWEWEIAELFGVEQANINMILRRVTWKHVPIDVDKLPPRRCPEARGEDHSRSVLTEKNVLVIFRMHGLGATRAEIAKAIGSNVATVNAVITRRTWKHVEVDPEFARLRGPLTGEQHVFSKLKEENIGEIFRLYNSGVSQGKIAKRFGVEQSTIGSIIRRESWSHIPIAEELIGHTNRPDVVEVFRLSSTGLKLDAIAERCKIGRSTVHRILRRESWPDIPIPAEYLPKPK